MFANIVNNMHPYQTAPDWSSLIRVLTVCLFDKSSLEWDGSAAAQW